MDARGGVRGDRRRAHDEPAARRAPELDGSTIVSPGATIDVTGIVNQASPTSTDGYQVLLMNAADCVPSPGGFALEILAGQAVVRWPHAGGNLVLTRSATMAPESWSPVLEEPAASGGLHVYREPAEAGRMFFQLDEP